MKSKIAIAALLLFWCGLQASAQESFVQTAMADLPNKTTVAFEPQAVTLNAKSNLTTAQLVNFRQQLQPSAENRVVRLLLDEANAVIFGYELTVEPLGGNQFRLTLAPLGGDFALPRLAGQKSSLAGNRRKTVFLTLPQKFENTILADGDALTVDLLQHPQLAVKIADKIRVSASRHRLLPPDNAPRDLTLNDLEMAIKNLKIKINDGEFSRISKLERTHAGSLLWLYLPSQGFIVLSLAPHEGYNFDKIGTVNEKTIKFALKNDLYEFVSDEPVLPFAGTWNLWVLHEPNYQPFFADFSTNFKYEPPEKQPLPAFENPVKLNGELSKTNERTGFDAKIAENPAPEKSLNRPPPIRVGAVSRIENILPKN